MPRKSDKKERLLQAARSLIHRQGFHQTTLAHISEESGISLGNLYYYFKTKEEIVAAVVEDRTERFHALTEEWDSDAEPRQRLARFLTMPSTICDSIVTYGCPVGSLSQELNKHSGPQVGLAAKPLRAQLDWVSKQFEQIDSENAQSLAQQFIARLQGASLLANAMKQPQILTEEVEQVRNWLQEL